jgi:hypothetical protein
MMEKRFETGKAPRIEITKCDGDLAISGWTASAVVAKGNRFTGAMEVIDEVMLVGEESLELTVPSAAELMLGEVTGSLTIKHIEGHIHIDLGQGQINLNDVGRVKIDSALGEFNGENLDGPVIIVKAMRDVQLRNVGDLSVYRAHGDVTVHYATGKVDLEEVSGSVSAHTVSGDLTVAKSQGDANLSNLGGRNNLSEIDGKILLVGGLASGQHGFAAGGNIIVRWPVAMSSSPAPAPAPLSLLATAALIRHDLQLENETKTTEQGQTILTGQIDEGKTFLTLKTPANIGIKAIAGTGIYVFDVNDFDFDFESPPIGAEPVEPAAGPYSPADIQKLRDDLADRIFAQLSQAGLSIDPGELHKTVAAAVTQVLVESLGPSDVNAEVPLAATSQSDAKHRAEKAIKGAERSMEQAEESMETARTSLQKQAQVQRQAAPSGPGPHEQVDAREPGPALPPDETMATEEHLHILKLLEEGHVSAKQALMLLNAPKA